MFYNFCDSISLAGHSLGEVMSSMLEGACRKPLSTRVPATNLICSNLNFLINW